MVTKLPRSAFWSAPVPWYWKVAPIATVIGLAAATLLLPGQPPDAGSAGIKAGDGGTSAIGRHGAAGHGRHGRRRARPRWSTAGRN